VRELEHTLEGAMNMVSRHDNTLELKHISVHFTDFMEQFAFAPGQQKKWRSPVHQAQGVVQGQEPAESHAGSPEHEPEAEKSSPQMNLSEKKALDEIKLIREALAASGGVPARAARSLGITRQLLHYKLKKYGLKP
jgi:arginine utilization regulatory protein